MTRTILQALIDASEMFPHSTTTARQLKGYARLLQDIPVELVIQALDECVKTKRFFPALAEIREAAVDIAGEGVIVTPEESWAEVMGEVRRVGYQQVASGKAELRFSSPMITRAVEAVGWRTICMTEIDDIPIVRSQFTRALAAIQNRAERDLVSGRKPDLTAIAGGASRAGFRSIGEIAESMTNERKA